MLSKLSSAIILGTLALIAIESNAVKLAAEPAADCDHADNAAAEGDAGEHECAHGSMTDRNGNKVCISIDFAVNL